MHSPILAPVITLVLWSFVVWLWMYAALIPELSKKKIRPDPHQTREAFQTKVAPRVRWKVDNYNHLMEQPTLFYATALALAVLGAGGGLNVELAWAYVALRVLHSLVQASVNIILLRFSIFTASSLVLLALAVRAAMLVCPALGGA